MKKLDARKSELMTLITQIEDANHIKSIAKLLKKLEEVAAEEAKLVALKDKIDTLNSEIANELKGYQSMVADRPKSNRGRKKKVA
jgi:5'-deoxynucleotidase YfbR-like HD superfamily hydrolase